MTAVLALVFLLARGMVDSSGFCWFPAPRGCAAGSAAVFRQVRTQRGTLADACAGAMLVLGLPGGLVPGLDLGLVSAAFSPAWGRGRRAAHGGTVRVGGGPVPDYLCAGDAGVVRRLFVWLPSARRSRILPFLCPALWSLPAMYVAGTFDPHVFLGLGVGGLAAGLLPARAGPEVPPWQLLLHRRWQAAWRRLPGSWSIFRIS